MSNLILNTDIERGTLNKHINIPNLRWPGDCFADEVHHDATQFQYTY